MKMNKRFFLSFVAPFMILISVIGSVLSENSRKIFYFPLGLMGISIILEKDVTLLISELLLTGGVISLNITFESAPQLLAK